MLTLAAGCVFNGGGGSETETVSQNFQLTGTVEDLAGLPVLNAQVSVWPDSLLLDPDWEGIPEPLARTSSDDEGRFAVDSLIPGRYRVFLRDLKGHSDLVDLNLEGEFRKVELGERVLKANASLSGRFDTAASSRFDRFVQVYGLPRLARCDAMGGWSLPGLPEGQYRLRFVTREPFRDAIILDSVAITAGNNLGLAAQESRTGVKLAPRITADGLSIPGLNRESPILYDNDICNNGLDMPFILPAISKGHLRVKGWIVTRDFRANTSGDLNSQVAACKDMIEQGRLSGFPIPILPVSGSAALLAPAKSGRLVDMQAIPSEGASLILTEAAKATRDNPLVYLAGANLSTLASAYLLDPTLAEKIVVFSIFGETINHQDSLANFLVAKKFRFVNWGQDYWTSIQTPTDTSLIPTHLLGLFARARIESGQPSLGDLALPLLLLRPKLFSGIRAKKLIGSPLKLRDVASGENGDIWIVVKEDNDFAALAKAVYDSLTAFKGPVQSDSALAGVSFAASKGAKAVWDKDGGRYYLQLADGASAQWNFEAKAAGPSQVTFKIRSPKSATLTLKVNAGANQNLTLAADTAWQYRAVTLELPADPVFIQALSGGATVDIDSLSFK